MERQKFQYEGMKWLMEMELLDDPQAINTIKLNILALSRNIKEVELLIYRDQKSMLVLLDLSWIGRKFFKKRIFGEVYDILQQLLPTFRFRVVDDPKIMELSIARVKQALTGGTYENSSNPSNSSSINPNEQTVEPSATVETQTVSGSTESSEPSAEEQSKAIDGILGEISKNNPEEK